MKKLVLGLIAIALLASCSKQAQRNVEGDQLNFLLNVQPNKGINYNQVEQKEIEKVLRKCVENTQERMRLLYFSEDLSEDLKSEKAISIAYNESKTIQSKQLGAIEVDRVILFLSGRLQADDSGLYIPIVTVHDGDVSVWYFQGVDEVQSLLSLLK
ncbi:hypothetical protein [Rummeliibacillus sp. POC4]|uniref:hypothetical protein n=1 Tax=Rummeliibacillus sp. POC4 TaxID=2305899 RepID=UPI000E6655E4|nr:hypothetical protein [Rummeliibacillus sp. POC4]RIJ69381.1 hypothetical protein D1606_01045 [Rummeliibacillus sp. POC4]